MAQTLSFFAISSRPALRRHNADARRMHRKSKGRPVSVQAFWGNPQARRQRQAQARGRDAAGRRAMHRDPHQSVRPSGACACQSTSSRSQQSLAPAGMALSIMIRLSRSSPRSLWTAEISIPRLSKPIIFLGGKFTMATSVLPMSSSGW